MATILALIFFWIPFNCIAKDFGTHGTVYPIQEEDIVEFLKSRLQSMTNEEITNINHQFKERCINKLKEPIPINISNAEVYRSYTFDPSVTAKDDILDSKGNIVVKKGTKVNPLDTISLQEELLFFDGSNERHLEWAKSIEGKWILTKGRPLELEEEENRAVYFDQKGVLIEKFKIKSIPAKVSQKGNLLLIEEIPVS